MGIIKKFNRSWYALLTKSRFENVVTESLTKKSMEVFLPKTMVRSKRRDRKKMIRIPLFPGYIFVKTDLHPDEHIEIVKTVGAVRLVGNNSGPVSVSDDAIDSLKIITATDYPVNTGTSFQKGMQVVVVSGPFVGVVGVFERYKGEGRVIVYIEALGQFAAVEVDESEIEVQTGVMIS